jgi:hypothetical protein
MLINKNIVKGPVGKDGKYTADKESMLLQTHKRKDNCNTRLKMILLITNLATGLSSPAFGKTKHEEEELFSQECLLDIYRTTSNVLL